MNHTFLLEEAVWDAEGLYSDLTRGVEFRCVAQSTVTHQPHVWTISGKMSLFSEPPVSFQNTYAVQPYKPEAPTLWTSFNPDLGKIQGQFIIEKNIILSTYATSDGQLEGQEKMEQIDPDTYSCVGMLGNPGRPLFSWTVTLHRRKNLN